MKLICVKTNEDYSDYLTLGKMYISDLSDIEIGNSKLVSFLVFSYYNIYDDKGNKRYVPKELLITLEDWRDNQIEKVLQ